MQKEATRQPIAWLVAMVCALAPAVGQGLAPDYRRGLCDARQLM
jgi:hypothetical protein